MASLQTIFNQFDLDKSGFIDLSQLREVAQRLGDPISQKQLKKLMSQIDVNKDGKISFLQFKQWWLKGHKGKLHDLIALKTKAKKSYSVLQQKLKNYGIDLQSYKPTVQSTNDSILLTLKVQNPQDKEHQTTSIKLGYLAGSQQYKRLIEQLGNQNPYLNKDIVSLTITIPTDEPKKLQQSLKDVVKTVLELINFRMGILINQEQLQTNQYMNIKITTQQNKNQKYVLIYFEPGKMIRQLLEQILKPKQQVFQTMGQGLSFSIDAQLTINTSFNQMLNSNRSIFQMLMQGCYANLHAFGNSSIIKLFKKFLYQSTKDPTLIPLLLFKKLQVDIQITTPQKLQEFFSKLGILDIVNNTPNLKELLQIIAPQLQQIKKKSQSGNGKQITEDFFESFYKMFKAFSKYANQGTKILLSKENWALFAYIEGKGLKKVFDTIFPEEIKKKK